MRHSRIALILTVKNERALLRSNIIYHHNLGVSEFFVFLDGTTDDTAETVRDMPYVRIAPSVEAGRFRHRPELHKFCSIASTHLDARQCLNTFAALEEARREGFDWLISLDADELICVNTSECYPGHLQDFFAAVPQQVEAVRFLPLEVVPRQVEYRNVFAEETLFKNPEAQIKHEIYDPFLEQIWSIRGNLGHTKGKSALRLVVPAVPKGVHIYNNLDGSRLNTQKTGYCLHYFCYDFWDFLKKFKNFHHHADTYLNGRPVPRIKQLWRDLVNHPNLSEKEILDYYQRWVMFSERRVGRLKRSRYMGLIRQRSPLVEVTSVKKAFTDMSERSSGACVVSSECRDSAGKDTQ